MKKVSHVVELSCSLALLVALALPADSLAEHSHHYDGESLGYLVARLRYARDEDDREDAAEELGKIGDPLALAALREAAVYDGDDDVREEAFKAIRRIERGSSKHRKGYVYSDSCAFTRYQQFPVHQVVRQERVPPWYRRRGRYYSRRGRYRRRPSAGFSGNWGR